MKIIAINTVTDSAEVAYLDGKQAWFQKAEAIKQQDQALLTVLQQLFDEKKITAELVDKIAVFTGPGRFAWVRTGLTVAKTLAFCWNKPVTAPSLEQVLRAQDHQATLLFPAGLDSFYYQPVGEELQVVKNKNLLQKLDPQQQTIGWGWSKAAELTGQINNFKTREYVPTALDLAHFSLALPSCDQSKVTAKYVKPLLLDKAVDFRSKLC